MSTLLEEWIQDVIEDPVTVAPGDVMKEARGNLWSFSLSSEQAAKIQESDLSHFIGRIIEARRAALTKLGCPPGAMIFYSWFDEQACQLRFSLISGVAALPFGCETVPAESLKEILDAFLLSPYHDGIPFSELSSSSESEEPVPQALKVWTTRLP